MNKIGVKQMKKTLKIVIGLMLILVLALVSWQVFLAPIKSEALSLEEAEQVAKERFDGQLLESDLVNDMYLITIGLDTGEYEIKISKESGEVLDVVHTKVEEPQKELTEADIKQLINEKDIDQIEKLDKKEQNGQLVYEATVAKDQKIITLKINGETGEITSQEEKDISSNSNKEANDKKKPSNNKNNDQGNKSSNKDKGRNITTAEAVQIALDTVYGEVDDIDLETKNGQLYYFIEIETKDDMEAEIQIHAITGEVISIEWDD